MQRLSCVWAGRHISDIHAGRTTRRACMNVTTCVSPCPACLPACPCVCAYAQTTPTLGSPAHWGTASWAIFMGFEHERIHIETSSVLIREVRGQPHNINESCSWLGAYGSRVALVCCPRLLALLSRQTSATARVCLNLQ